MNFYLEIFERLWPDDRLAIHRKPHAFASQFKYFFDSMRRCFRCVDIITYRSHLATSRVTERGDWLLFLKGLIDAEAANRLSRAALPMCSITTTKLVRKPSLKLTATHQVELPVRGETPLNVCLLPTGWPYRAGKAGAPYARRAGQVKILTNKQISSSEVLHVSPRGMETPR